MQAHCMTYRISFYVEGRTVGNVSCDVSLHEAVRLARGEMVSRGADFFYIVDDAGADVWHEGREP